MRIAIDISRVDYFGFGVFVFVDDAPSEPCRTVGPSVSEERLCKKRHACMEGEQPVGSRRAADVDCDQDSTQNRPLSPSGSESFGHINCKSTLHRSSQEQRPNDSHSSESEETRGDSPRPVPSNTSQIPDFRDLARFEWRFR